jgi:exosortase A-associated hydrolase 2
MQPCRSVDAFFMDGPAGKLFAVHHLPKTERPARGHVLLVPAFNEEMNRCRSMVTMQAQAFANIGFGTLVVDLFGTGDSDGDFSDARWDIWLQDIVAAYSLLSARASGRCAILGVRLGAILAVQALPSLASKPLALMLWQPVTDGKLHMTQFLRVRMAANLDRPHLPKESTASMREQFLKGQCVEVAGYLLHPELARAIDDAKLEHHAPFADLPTLWQENANGQSQDIALPSQKVISAWSGKNVMPTVQTFPGPAFWQVHERVVASSIISQTSTWLDQTVPAS